MDNEESANDRAEELNGWEVIVLALRSCRGREFEIPPSCGGKWPRREEFGLGVSLRLRLARTIIFHPPDEKFRLWRTMAP